ncbi:hypothetical protein GCM10023314_16300 [Algibacter agarivorans]|uniref:Uncharacterized protein n=1 Tax=Algibacter agarivorans TaxID=1109741 RepID=A0ABP9GLK6_9FLAO
MILEDKITALKTPLVVSQRLKDITEKAFFDIKDIVIDSDKELHFTVNDIKTVSFLGKYYAYKIEGATYLALYRKSDEKEYQKLAVKSLEEALVYWEKYISQAMSQNHNPLWTNRVGIVDWKQITEWVKQDIEIAKQ